MARDEPDGGTCRYDLRAELVRRREDAAGDGRARGDRLSAERPDERTVRDAMNRAAHPCRIRRAYPRAAGLSLVELLVSIALGLMVLAGVIVVFANSSAARNELERSSRQIENGRYALELLSSDLRMAGFYGELGVGLLPVPAAMPDPCSTA